MIGFSAKNEIDVTWALVKDRRDKNEKKSHNSRGRIKGKKEGKGKSKN